MGRTCWCGKNSGHWGKHAEKPNVKPGPAKGAKYKRRKQRVPKTCAQCGKKFAGLLPRGRFCSRRCRDAATYQRRKARRNQK